MGLNCSCPTGAAIPSIDTPECKESLGQVQKVIFQRRGQTIASADIKSLEQMQALKSANNSTKIAVSPYIQNPATEVGTARTFGGGNQTLGGVEMIIGREATKFTGVIYETAQSVVKQLKEMMCEDLGVYLIDENGNIACINGEGSTSYSPIPVRSLFVGDKNLGGYEEPDSNAIEWSFLPNWSDDLAIIKQSDLDYNPLTEL